jgi:predicted phosphodiesterase
MRYGILSDIHGNLEALETVIRACQEEGIKEYLCLGDIIGYGANPKECIKRVQGLNSICIAGNHDWAVSGKFDPMYFNEMAKEAVFWTQDQLSSEDFDYLNNLPLVFKNEDLILVHGTLEQPDLFDYLVDIGQAPVNFDRMDRIVCFVGHTHVPQSFIKTGEKIRCAKTLELTLNPQNKYIINVGSIGQPRDGDPRASFCVYDSDNGTVDIRRISYDLPLAQKKILEAGLPQFLAFRLALGR